MKCLARWAENYGQIRLSTCGEDSVEAQASSRRIKQLRDTGGLQELGARRTSIEPKELALLKEEFGLSMSAILCRARDLGIISQEYHKRTMINFCMLGWHRVEPGPQYPSEKTHVFEQHIFHALGEGYIGEAKAAELLGMPLINFRHFRALEKIHAIPHQ